jgi:hypothetical protein
METLAFLQVAWPDRTWSTMTTRIQLAQQAVKLFNTGTRVKLEVGRTDQRYEFLCAKSGRTV